MRTLFDFSGRRSSFVQFVQYCTYCGAVLHMQGSHLGAAFKSLVYSLVSSRASAYHVLCRWPLVFFRLADPDDTCDTHRYDTHQHDIHQFDIHQYDIHRYDTTRFACYLRPSQTRFTTDAAGNPGTSSAFFPMSDTEPSVKPKFWRIHGIKTTERDAAWTWLQEQVEHEMPEGQGFSLARCDYERHTMCATLTSGKKPIPPSNRLHWKVDHKFEGFTPLNDPEDADVDIVAITGLGGHALGSFRATNGAFVWLRDSAPEDMPTARFLTYGYDTTVVGSNDEQGIEELARTLLEYLSNFRSATWAQQRPLVFVCHSLGGVVLKQALVRSSQVVELEHAPLRQVELDTCGLVMMGVPNHGLLHHELAAIVSKQPNRKLIANISVDKKGEPTDYLRHLTSDFCRLDKYRAPKYKLVSYYEQWHSPTIVSQTSSTCKATATDLRQTLEEGKPKMTEKKKVLMVSKDSAGLIGHDNVTNKHLPRAADHRGLARFEHSDEPQYRSLITNLKQVAGLVEERNASTLGRSHRGLPIATNQSSDGLC